MPKIQWERLPSEKWAHLRDRARERQISQDDLFALAEWKAEDPDVVQRLRNVQTVWYGTTAEYLPAHRASRPREAVVVRVAACPYGSAYTSIAFTGFGGRISLASDAGIDVPQLPPPVPTGTAMYCLPFAM